MRTFRGQEDILAVSRPEGGLFQFEWAVDQHGYEPASAEELPPGDERPVLEEPPTGGGWWIRRRGGPLRRYRPLESCRGLARRFAYLSKEPQALCDFANQYGFPLRTLQEWEQGRTIPTGASRAFLLVIDREPKAVKRALVAALV